jgi:hypothetical protein
MAIQLSKCLAARRKTGGPFHVEGGLPVVMKTSRIALFVLALSAPLGALSAQPETSTQPSGSTETASEQQAATQQVRTRPSAEERRICRRLETTGSRTGAQRVCMTAEQWRRADN